MIIFDGTISGNAETFHYQQERSFNSALIVFVFLTMLPVAFFISKATEMWIILPIFTIGCVATFILTSLALGSPKDLPRHIAIQDDCITVKYGNNVLSYYVQDVKKVFDYDAFYYLSFPFGKKNCKFICQKDLLSEGTLEEFESLFEGKIIKKKIELPLC